MIYQWLADQLFASAFGIADKSQYFAQSRPVIVYYPGFHTFALMIQKQATLKNHPNVSAGDPNSDQTKKSEKRGSNEYHAKAY